MEFFAGEGSEEMVELASYNYKEWCNNNIIDMHLNFYSLSKLQRSWWALEESCRQHIGLTTTTGTTAVVSQEV